MHRTNANGNQRNHRRCQPVQNVIDDDSRSQVDSETSIEDEAIEEERSPFVTSVRNNDVDEYVKRLRKTGTADNVSAAALTQGMGMIAVKTGAAYMARFGRMSGKGDDIVDEDDIVGGGAAVATKLNPSQQQMMNQMAPQASGAAAGGVAAPMMSVVVPTPIGSAAASSAAATVRLCHFRDKMISYFLYRLLLPLKQLLWLLLRRRLPQLPQWQPRACLLLRNRSSPPRCRMVQFLQPTFMRLEMVLSGSFFLC